ncbi:MAG: rRNA maturation RNase YbeY [Spirochaetales bacterium]|nr:rRNA maturation RNase YbeY [Spirochaetales bacterium]
MNRVDIQFEEIDIISDKSAASKKIRMICGKIFDILSIMNWELSLVVCGDSFIKKLNCDFRGKDEPTDVLSFPQIESSFPAHEDGTVYAGDIVISMETLIKNSEKFKVDINEEFIRLLIHGILHLKGFTHSDNSPEQEMLILQEDILKKFTGVEIF